MDARFVHKHGGITLLVDSQSALDAALAHGWVIDPNTLPPLDAPEPVVVDEPRAIDEIEALMMGGLPEAVTEPLVTDDDVSPDGPAKRKPGRPSKAQKATS